MHQELRDFPEDRWKALAKLLIRKRVELSPRYHKRTVFAREHGLNYKLICDIEQAKRRDFSPPTIIAIEQIYNLGHGFIRQYLTRSDDAGDEPNGERAA